MTEPGHNLLDYASREAQRQRPWWHVRLRDVFIIIGIFTLLAAVLRPMIIQTRGSPRVACMANLRALGIAMLQYSTANQGAYPDSWETLILSGYVKDGRPFVCEQSGDYWANAATPQALAQMLASMGRPDAFATASTRPKTYLSYIYCGNGLTTKTRNLSKTVVAYEPLCNHHGKIMNVLFADGHVEMLHPAVAVPMVNNLQSGLNPPSTAPSTAPSE